MTRLRLVSASDDLSQKQTRKLKVDEATVLFMINTSRTKFFVLNVAKSEIISHSKLSKADLDLKQTGQLLNLICPIPEP